MNKYQKSVFSLCLAFGLLALNPSPAKAQVTAPVFPACSNPQGTLKASYETGVHGIVGNASQFTGSDKVYAVNETMLIQCFCSQDGNGIQTNWWRIDQLAQDEIDSLKNLGWIFVPSGSVWGLDDPSYMAKNSDYVCRPDSTAVTSESANDNNSGSGGLTLGSSVTTPGAGSVLGFSATGNSFLIYSLLILGLASILLGKTLGKGTRILLKFCPFLKNRLGWRPERTLPK